MLKRNLIANYFGQIWTALMALAFVPLYIKYLGIEAYGLIGLFAVLQGVFNLLDLGMTPALSREMARYTGGIHSKEWIRDLLRSVEVVAVGIAALMASVVALGSDWIATSWLKAGAISTDVVAQAFTVMGLVSALRFAEGIYRGAIMGLQKHVLFNSINSIMATFRWGGVIGVLEWVSPTVSAFFIWHALCSFATILVLGFYTYHAIPSGSKRAKFSLATLRSCWKFAGGMVLISVSVIILTSVDKILLSKLVTLKEYGYYTLALAVTGGLTFLCSPVAQTFQPKMVELHTECDKKAFSKSFHLGAQIVTTVMGSSAVVVIIFSDYLLSIWTQDQAIAAKASLLLSMLAFGTLINGMMVMPYIAQISTGWTKLTLYTNFASIAVLIPLLLILVDIYGLYGAAIVWILLNLGYFIGAVNFMFRKMLIDDKWSWYLNDVTKPLISSFLGVSILRITLPESATNIGMAITLLCASLVSIVASLSMARNIRTLIFPDKQVC